MVQFVGIGLQRNDFDFLDEAIRHLLVEQELTPEEAEEVMTSFAAYKPTLFRDYRRIIALPEEAKLDEHQATAVKEALVENARDICGYYNTVLAETALFLVGLLAEMKKLRR